jgi:pimeloyl-ACP methyl ester carboxylesterase
VRAAGNDDRPIDGSLITLQFAIGYPELVPLAIPMGTSAKATGFTRDWIIAEVTFPRTGGQLPADFAMTHYAAFSYPSEVLGNGELWATIRAGVGVYYGGLDGDPLVALWQACIDVDVVDQLPRCHVPIEVTGFREDCQCPAAQGRRVAALAPNAHFHLLPGLSHLSCEVHEPEVDDKKIRELMALRSGRALLMGLWTSSEIESGQN